MNHLYYGDNLTVLRDSIKDASVESELSDSDIMAYLAMMAVRLVELQRVLEPTGSLYSKLLHAVFEGNLR